MKINLIRAAQDLSMNFAQLMLVVYNYDKTLSFSEVWPELDEQIYKVILSKHSRYNDTEIVKHEEVKESPKGQTYSIDVIKVLDKLERKGKWGSASLSFEAIQNIVHIPKTTLEKVIIELLNLGLMTQDSNKHGTYSLVAGKRRDIYEILQR